MSDALPAPVPVVVEAIEALLTAVGPTTLDRVSEMLCAAGVPLGREPQALLQDLLDGGDLPLVDELTDGRLVLLPALLDGRVFTHRVVPSEVSHDLLVIDPDLSPVSMLLEAERYQRLSDGSPLVEMVAGFDDDELTERGIPLDDVPDDALLLPRGALQERGVSAGDLVGLRVTAQGFDLDCIADPADPPADVSERLLAILTDRDTDGPDQLDTLVWTACADDPALFDEPLPPLGQLLDAGGLSHDSGQVAPPGFDWVAWRVLHRIGLLARRHDLAHDEALALLAISTMYDQVADLYDAALAAGPAEPAGLRAALQRAAMPGAGPPGPDSGPKHGGGEKMRDCLTALSEPAVAVALLAEAVDVREHSLAALELFAEVLEPMAPRSARPALRWLRASAQEMAADPAQAEATLAEAERLDPTWPPTLYALARFAGDRGDAERGLALLRRAGAPDDDPLVELLQRFRPRPRADLGRNQPCWCGSGRKYKHCHLHREELPLAERAGWLYQKAVGWLVSGPWREAVVDAAEVRSRHWDFPAALLAALEDELVLDAVLFEGGAFADFLTGRGSLLPDDERLLAGQWLLLERSLFEIEAVQPGIGLTVRDLRTGDHHEVTDMTAGRRLKPGALVCARVVPAGDTMQVFGGIEPVGRHQRDELMTLLDSEPDPVELVAALSRRFAPPQLANTEGDPLVLCEATLRIPDPLALTVALTGTYDRQDGDDPEWIEYVTTDGLERIRATMQLRGDELHVQTNSEARLDRVLATLGRLQPSVTLIGEQRRPATDLPQISEHPVADNVVDVTDPQIRAALEQMMQQYERSWLEEPIPALAGHTPRQAAEDPTRRADLVALLDSFPHDPDNPGAMNPVRLRVALGLD